ncbi:MAG: GNAT family N-acetyltransferase [Pirellulaceae bacterium]|nr:GNAT family N-acetyltransferase [Planctomycetales bacterium]
MELRMIEVGSTDYQSELALRYRYLRAPLGLSWSDTDLSEEPGQCHFGLFHDDTLIGCVVGRPVSQEQVHIRQMVVVPSHQQRGFGRDLLIWAEEQLIARGYASCFLNARVEAIGFYEKCGYTTIGERFIEVTIPHQRMFKQLADLPRAGST